MRFPNSDTMSFRSLGADIEDAVSAALPRIFRQGVFGYREKVSGTFSSLFVNAL
jgi:hypothetical protein